jgi:triacylglycerol esterase/lipase EstA (alpha/beta hydrolase family)
MPSAKIFGFVTHSGDEAAFLEKLLQGVERLRAAAVVSAVAPDVSNRAKGQPVPDPSPIVLQPGYCLGAKKVRLLRLKLLRCRLRSLGKT